MLHLQIDKNSDLFRLANLLTGGLMPIVSLRVSLIEGTILRPARGPRVILWDKIIEVSSCHVEMQITPSIDGLL